MGSIRGVLNVATADTVFAEELDNLIARYKIRIQ